MCTDNKEYWDKVNFVAEQVKETVKQESQGVTIRMATMTCRCGWKRAVMHMFQCLYCREWFCIRCAEHHFGKTIEQYKAEKATEI